MTTRTETPALAAWVALALTSMALPSCARGPAAVPASVVAPAVPGTLAVRMQDHLGFGLRLESVAVRVDGRPVVHDAGAGGSGDLGSIALAKGVHSVAVLARVSVSCGLLDAPRAAVAVRASEMFRVGEGPASLAVDLFVRAPIAKPSDMPAIGLTGRGLVLGVKEARDASEVVHPTCGGLDAVAAATCDVEAAVADARGVGDAQAEACGLGRLVEIRRLRDVLDKATADASANGTTNEIAMHSQLRARYAESRIRTLAAETARCMQEELAAAPQPVDEVCPGQDLALGGR